MLEFKLIKKHICYHSVGPFQLQISENFVIFTVYLINLGNYTFTNGTRYIKARLNYTFWLICADVFGE